MATEDQIAQLRLMINQPDNVEPWTDANLALLIDSSDGDLQVAAGKAWRSKASTVAHLVDISEGGSSRKNSEIYKNYLAMANVYDPETEEPAAASGPSRTRQIERA